LPKFTKSLVLKQATASASKKPVLHDTVVEERAIPELKPGQVLVRITAAAFNHRDVGTLHSNL
jgi:NADPH:quinone reductase-like Zn-dependent oxidoreductase